MTSAPAARTTATSDTRWWLEKTQREGLLTPYLGVYLLTSTHTPSPAPTSGSDQSACPHRKLAQGDSPPWTEHISPDVAESPGDYLEPTHPDLDPTGWSLYDCGSGTGRHPFVDGERSRYTILGNGTASGTAFQDGGSFPGRQPILEDPRETWLEIRRWPTPDIPRRHHHLPAAIPTVRTPLWATTLPPRPVITSTCTKRRSHDKSARTLAPHPGMSLGYAAASRPSHVPWPTPWRIRDTLPQPLPQQAFNTCGGRALGLAPATTIATAGPHTYHSPSHQNPNDARRSPTAQRPLKNNGGDTTPNWRHSAMPPRRASPAQFDPHQRLRPAPAGVPSAAAASPWPEAPSSSARPASALSSQ